MKYKIFRWRLSVRYAIVKFFAVALFFTIYNKSNSQGLYATAEKINITPKTYQKLVGYAPRMSDSVKDSIYHRILIIKDEQEEVIIISTELVGVSPSAYEEVAGEVETLTGINKKNIFWTFTHTHSAPEVGLPGIGPLFLESRYDGSYDEEYTSFVFDTLVRSILQLRKQLKPAKIGIGFGYSKANINRRAKTTDNRIFLGENPDAAIDRKIGVIRVDDLEGKPIGMIANYPIHGTVLPTTDTRISGDVPGIVSKYVENNIGAPMLFINGAEGNIAPRYSVPMQKSLKQGDHLLNQFKVLLGDKILDTYNKIINTTDNINIKTDRVIVETLMKESLQNKWPEELKNLKRISSTGDHLLLLPVSFLLLNDDILIWSAPIEMFCEISNNIRVNSPFPSTMYFGLTNGSLGYLPTKKGIELGGYEPTVSPFTIDAEMDLTNRILNYLNNISISH